MNLPKGRGNMANQYLLVMYIVFWYHVIALWVLWSVRTQANEATKDVGFAEITIKVSRSIIK